MVHCLRNSLFAFLLLVACGARGQVVITTYAGTPNGGGYLGDGGSALVAALASPSDVVVDAIGNLFIADFINNVVRKVDTFGNISTYAGTGFGAGGTATGSYTGDNGPATDATMNGPFALALDKTGNLFIADGYNHLVRKVDAAGIITTYAGRLAAGYSGDGGPATAATLNNPVGLALDTAGNLYIADDHNNVIRKVTPAGIISTFAGNSTAGYGGNGGPATAAMLNTPIGVAVDHRGNVYIADAPNNTVRKVDTAGVITAYVGGADTAHGYSGNEGPAVNARLYYPVRMAFDDSDNMYLADAFNSVIRKITPEGSIFGFAGTGDPGFSGDGGAPDTALMNATYGVAINSHHVIYIADRGNEIIRRVGPPIIAESASNTTAVRSAMNVYPNPVTSGTLNVRLSAATAENAALTITNMLGQVVSTQAITTNKQVAVSMRVPAGIYVISAVGAHGNWKTEVVVE